MKLPILSLVLLTSVLYGISFARPKACRCLYGDLCWPSESDFSSLAAQVSQPLIQPLPPASACYPIASPQGNCSEVTANWDDGIWRSNQMGAMQSSNFETYIFSNNTIAACYLNTTLVFPCTQGSVPIIGVDARSPEDIQAAVKFVANHNLRLVVKNTGHDYLGRSAARGSFVVWTHNMKNISFTDSFIPDGAPTTEVYENALTLGAGVQWHEAYDAAHAKSVVVVGGLSAGGSVGAAGGWMQGGGHSALAPAYGLGVDNVLQLSVVTANGDHLTANTHQNSDLFWALRGGGGGTYGIDTSVTYKTRPSMPLIAAFFASSINSPTTEPSAILTQLFTEWVRISPALSDAGWGGYSILTPGSNSPSVALQVFLIAPNISWTQANDSLNPFFAFAQSLASNSSIENGGALQIDANLTLPMDSFYAWESRFFRTTGQVGSNTELGSRLLPRTTIEKDYKKVALALLPLPGANYFLVAGGQVAKVDSSSTGLNPAWRKALIHTVFATGWPEGTSVAGIREAESVVKKGIANLHALAPDSGAYFNEASLFEPNPQFTFFGSHYARLKDIKQKYDPNGLFVVAKGVGSEDWDASLNCRK